MLKFLGVIKINGETEVWEADIENDKVVDPEGNKIEEHVVVRFLED